MIDKPPFFPKYTNVHTIQALLQRVAYASSSRVVFATRMRHPSLCALQTSVLTGHQHLVPPSVWLAMATSAAHVLHEGSSNYMCLTDITLSQRQVLLQPTRPPGASNVSLDVSVDLETGHITVTRQTVTLLNGHISSNRSDDINIVSHSLLAITPQARAAVVGHVGSLDAMHGAVLPPALLEAGLQLCNGGQLAHHVDALVVAATSRGYQQSANQVVAALPSALCWPAGQVSGHVLGVHFAPLAPTPARRPPRATSQEPTSFAQALGNPTSSPTPDARAANRLAALRAMAPAERTRLLKSQVKGLKVEMACVT